jgi:hypothetical protein
MAGYTFTGQPIHFCYSDPRKIRCWLTQNLHIHDDPDEKVGFVSLPVFLPPPSGVVGVAHFFDKVRFAAGTYVKSYWNQTLSVWVMVCKLNPL